MRARWLFGVALVATGCFEKPPFAGNDGALATGVDGDGGLIVYGGGFQMRFSARGYGFPDSFDVGGTELLGHGDTCEDEDGFGIGGYPAGILAGLDPPARQAVVGGRQVRVELDTPFVVKVGITWSASFTGGCAFAPHGRTSFTFFLGGHIHRHDHVIDGSAAPTASCHAACPEAAGDGWAVTSYTTFRAAADQHISHIPRPAYTDHGPGQVFTDATSCVSAPGYGVAIGWSENARHRRLRVPADDSLSFVEDLIDGTPMTMPPLDERVHTPMVVADAGGGESCGAAEARLISYYDGNPQLVVNGTSLDAQHDGIWGGEIDDGQVGYPVDDAPVTLVRGSSPDVPGGFVVWLRFESTHAGFEVTSAGGRTNGEWFAYAAVPSTTGVVFWFRDPLGIGQTITITPRD